MNPSAPRCPELASLLAKDAVYFSGHKFVGGPGSPGVLVVKRRLMTRCAVPTAPGGGTVFFVTERDHRFLSRVEEREEGGTPDIVGSIRLGLAVQVKQRVGSASEILQREEELVQRVTRSLRGNRNIVLLGDHACASGVSSGGDNVVAAGGGAAVLQVLVLVVILQGTPQMTTRTRLSNTRTRSTSIVCRSSRLWCATATVCCTTASCRHC
ncbi:hypothetical protein PINS_up005570 [Pythium insidiosum]|nr:hypothetical protein PINS_up005570 [Pythium insidiosum]